MIHREGEEANHFYLIRSGKVSSRLWRRTKVPYYRKLHEGDILGWSCLCRPTLGALKRERWTLHAWLPSMESVYGISAKLITILGTNCLNACRYYDETTWSHNVYNFWIFMATDLNYYHWTGLQTESHAAMAVSNSAGEAWNWRHFTWNYNLSVRWKNLHFCPVSSIWSMCMVLVKFQFRSAVIQQPSYACSYHTCSRHRHESMDKMRRGDILGIRGPYGTPCQLIKQTDWMLFSLPVNWTGTAASDVIWSGGTSWEVRKGRFMYGTRTPSDVLFRQELENWRARFDLEIYVTLIARWAAGEAMLVSWQTLFAGSVRSRNTMAFVCGPEIMMRFTAMELHKRGVDNEHILCLWNVIWNCAIGLCGHCQFGSVFVCKDGPVFQYIKLKIC